MLLESALTELAIDLNQQQLYVDNVVLEMCSPSESLSDQRIPSKEHVTLPLAEGAYGTPGSVPFGWEIEPGIPKQETTGIPDGVDRSPLRLPPSAYSSPSPNRHSQGYITWNISPGRRHLALAASVHRKSVVTEYDGDDESVGAELDSKEGGSPVSTLGRMSLSPDANINSPSHCYHFDGLRHSVSAANSVAVDSVDCQNSGELVTEAAASSAAKSCATLLWGVFPCSSKCFFQHKDKNKANGSQVAGLSKENSDLVVFEAVPEKAPRPVPSALKKKRRKSSWGGRKQVRFSVEDAGNRSGGAPASSVAPPNELQWASYGLF